MAAAMLAALAAGCASSASPTPLSQLQAGGEQWQFPASWNLTQAGDPVPGPQVSLTFISSVDRIGGNCQGHEIRTCWPLQRLSPGGVLVALVPLGTLTPPVTGEPWRTVTATAGTMPVTQTVPGICGDIDGEVTLTGIAPLMPDGSGDYELVACLRGPGLDAGEIAVSAIFSSFSRISL